MRQNACASSAPVAASSKPREMRIASAVAASASTTRSPSTLRISGCSTRRLAKAVRCATWCDAWITAWRMNDAGAVTVSLRVWCTMSRIVRTPRPSSPTIRAHVSWYSISDDALEWLPSLSFRRWTKRRLRVPSGRQRGTRKHESPRAVLARVRNASDIGAEQNHLWPVSRYSLPGPPAPTGRATVLLARTSEPPCFSVIAMPKVAPLFSSTGMQRGSYDRAVTFGSHSAAISGCRRSAGTTAYVIVSGQHTPASTCDSR